MTYEPWKQNEYLIRFEHIMDKNDDPELSLPYTFDISEIFPGNFEFTEMNLAANQRIEEVNRLHFRQEGSQQSADAVEKTVVKALTDPTITLNPMQIRTFIVSPIPAQTSESTVPTSQTVSQTVAPTPAPTNAPSSANVISINASKFVSLVILAAIVKVIL